MTINFEYTCQTLKNIKKKALLDKFPLKRLYLKLTIVNDFSACKKSR